MVWLKLHRWSWKLFGEIQLVQDLLIPKYIIESDNLSMVRRINKGKVDMSPLGHRVENLQHQCPI